MSIIHSKHFDNVCSNGSEEGTGENGMEREREGERKVNEGQRGKEQERDRMRGWWGDAE